MTEPDYTVGVCCDRVMPVTPIIDRTEWSPPLRRLALPLVSGHYIHGQAQSDPARPNQHASHTPLERHPPPRLPVPATSHQPQPTQLQSIQSSSTSHAGVERVLEIFPAVSDLIGVISTLVVRCLRRLLPPSTGLRLDWQRWLLEYVELSK